jgi:putative membrane protein
VLPIATRRRFRSAAPPLHHGEHHAYALVPFDFWLRDAFGFTRNHYAASATFAQGFVPAIAAREILIRLGVVRGRRWLFSVVVAFCLAISAAYELLEWIVAEMSGSKGDSFLGTQGDIWDTQKDMALALLGAVVAQLALGRLHDRQLDAVDAPAPVGYLHRPAAE